MSQDMNDQSIQRSIATWIDEFIIGENICPFAKKEREANSISMVCYQADSMQRTAQTLLTQLAKLANDDSIETCIVIASSGLDAFDEYLIHLDEANYQLSNNGYEGTFQIASFHPQYQFEGEPADALSNYSNRSPFPAFHIIREQSITNALKSFPNPERIPARNMAHCEKLGHAFFERLFAKC